MAITLNLGTGGSALATDTVAGEEYQRITLYTPLGQSIVDDTNDAMKVVNATAANLNMTEANSASMLTALQLIDNAVSGAGFNITQFAGAAVPIGGGVEATAMRVTLANDSTGVITVDGTVGVSGSVSVDMGANNDVIISNDDTVSVNNSTTTPLAGSGTFVGTGDDCLGYSSVAVTIYANVASATDGMTFEFSTDNSNWDDSYLFTLGAGETRRFQFPVTARYFRINYTNGAGAQASFRVQTILHRQNILTSIHRIEDNVSTDRSAQLVKSSIIAQVNGSGDFVPIQANAAGILKIGGSVDIDSIVPGTGATAFGKAIDSAAGGTDTGIAILAVRDDEQAAITPIDGDYTNLTVDKFGKLKVTLSPDATSVPKYAVINASSSGDNTLVAAAGAGIKIRVLACMMVAAGAVNVRLESGASGTALSGQMPLTTNSGFTLPYNPDGWCETADNTLLNLELSAAVGVHGLLTYVEV